MGEDLTICLQGIKQNKNKKNNNINNTKFLKLLLLLLVIHSSIIQSVTYLPYRSRPTILRTLLIRRAIAATTTRAKRKEKNTSIGNTTTIKGIVMYNCGVGLNSRGIANDDRWDPVQKALINRCYDVLCFLIFKRTSDY